MYHLHLDAMALWPWRFPCSPKRISFPHRPIQQIHLWNRSQETSDCKRGSLWTSDPLRFLISFKTLCRHHNVKLGLHSCVYLVCHRSRKWTQGQETFFAYVSGTILTGLNRGHLCFRYLFYLFIYGYPATSVMHMQCSAVMLAIINMKCLVYTFKINLFFFY